METTNRFLLCVFQGDDWYVKDGDTTTYHPCKDHKAAVCLADRLNAVADKLLKTLPLSGFKAMPEPKKKLKEFEIREQAGNMVYDHVFNDFEAVQVIHQPNGMVHMTIWNPETLKVDNIIMSRRNADLVAVSLLQRHPEPI